MQWRAVIYLLVVIMVMRYIRVFLWNLVQLDMKYVEDETVEGRTQTITQPTDSRNHTLTHAYRNKSFSSWS